MKIKVACASLLLLIVTGVYASAQEPVATEKNQMTVNVLGAVNKPARYVLPVGATVLDALASAGDVAQNGNRSQIRLIHITTGDKPDWEIIELKSVLSGLSKAKVLREGDTLVVSDHKANVTY